MWLCSREMVNHLTFQRSWGLKTQEMSGFQRVYQWLLAKSKGESEASS